MSERIKTGLRIGILFALLLIPILFALFLAADLSYSWLKKIAYLGVVVVCLLLPALFLKARTYFIIEGIFNFLFFPIDIASLYLNKQSASAPFLQNILQTNAHETMELLASLWPACVGVMLLWVLYSFLACRVENRYLVGPVVRKVVIGATVVLFIGGVGAMMFVLKRLHQERTVKDSLAEAVELVEMKFYKIFPYNLYIHSYHLMQRHQRVKQLQKQVETFSFGLQPVKGHSDELVVLVIGEAARYDHFGINGYERNTTPCLDGIQNLISFDAVYTQANQTAYAVPVLLTRATADSFDVAYTEKSLPEAFQEAGFWSGYISKQVLFDITERISESCDYAHSYAKDFDIDGNYDAQMIDQVRAETRDTMQFFVLHSLGSHFRYEHRVPVAFDYYQPILGRAASYTMISEENKEQLINAYDNSILYTDYFLSSLTAYMDSLHRPAVMVYISDHGESFWDDARKLSLHSSYQVSEAEYHVPMLVWYSDEYAALHPQKTEALHANKAKHVSSDVVFYSLLDLAGINGIVDATRSICAPSLISRDSVLVHSGAGEIMKIAVRDLQEGNYED
ncbi:MAG: sulfatase-like hydrolase/transferase [Paludibacteraceae bacterium]|nr:sulfatase-like hydrolase/transferase [Paludibacteraceae bacterium]